MSSRSLVQCLAVVKASSSVHSSTLTCGTSTRSTPISWRNRLAVSCRPTNFCSQVTSVMNQSCRACPVRTVTRVLASFAWEEAPQCLVESTSIRRYRVSFLVKIFNNRTSLHNFLKMALCKMDKNLHKTNIQILKFRPQIIMTFRIR